MPALHGFKGEPHSSYSYSTTVDKLPVKSQSLSTTAYMKTKSICKLTSMSSVVQLLCHSVFQ